MRSGRVVRVALVVGVIALTSACSSEQSSGGGGDGSSAAGEGGTSSGAGSAGGKGALEGVGNGYNGPNTNFSGDPCPWSYDLPSYDGATDDLCPAREVNHCDCDAGAEIFYICSENTRQCITQGANCGGPYCGWRRCDLRDEPDAFCESLADQMPEHFLAPRACTRDADCDGGLCNVRFDNLMVCSNAPGVEGAGGSD